MSKLRLLSFNQESNAHLFFNAKTVSSSILRIHYAALASLQDFTQIVTNNSNQLWM